MRIDNSTNYLAAYQRTAAMQTANLNISGSYLEITGGANGSYYANSADGVDISDKARELADRIKELDIFKVIYPNNDARQKTKSLSEVEGDFMADFTDFAGSFGSMLSMAGLDSSQSFTMGLNGVGGMTVTGSDAASAEKLQQTMSANQTTTSRFAVMAARAALADAGYTLDGFKESYGQDPIGAIQDNIDELKQRLLGFRATGSGGNMQYGFIRDFNMNIDYSSTSVSYTQAQEAATAEIA